MPKKSPRSKAPAAKKARASAARSAPRSPAKPAKSAPARQQPVEVTQFLKPKRTSLPAPRKMTAKESAEQETSRDNASLIEGDTGRAFPIEVDSKQLEQTLMKIREEVSHWAKKGRYTKIRFKFRGKQLLPDLPLVAVVAAEGLTFYWTGILRALIFNIAGKAVFDVELVNDSEKRIQAGREALLSGDADRALGLFREALDMDRNNANAHLNMGIALRLKGDLAAARLSLEKARELDKLGPFGAEAEKILNTFPKPGSQTVVNG
jgi:tetratricopeptide (TPR) repeat protein